MGKVRIVDSVMHRIFYFATRAERAFGQVTQTVADLGFLKGGRRSIQKVKSNKKINKINR